MTAPRRRDIPFNRPSAAGRELDYVAQALRNGRISGDGPFSRDGQALLESLHGSAKALLTTSCTHALEMAALLLGLRPGDEVLVPAFTFVSTINAFVLHGARPAFVDIRPDTLNLDEALLPAALAAHPRARAVVPVHYGGVGCAMEPILSLARERGLTVVEDNAHGLFGRYRGRLLGTFGALATLSFHETKNVTCGEGGALLVNDPALVPRAEILREKGTNRSRFFRGEVDKYTWVDVGSSYLLSDLLAAFLYGQLEAREAIQAARRRVWERYGAGLEAWAGENGVRLPTVPADREQSFHMFYLLLPTPESQAAFRSHMRERGILAVFHYQPLHLSAMGRRFGGREGDCPVTEELSARLVRLPFYNGLAAAEQDAVIEAALAFKP